MTRPLTCSAVERAGEVEQGDGTFILVAMIAAGQQRRRPLAALRTTAIGIITDPQAESSRL